MGEDIDYLILIYGKIIISGFTDLFQRYLIPEYNDSFG